VSVSDLPLEINTDFKLMLYTDDTGALIFYNNMHETQAKLSTVLNTLNYLFTSNGVSLNLKKTKLFNFETTYRKNTPFCLSYKDELLQNETNIRFLGLEMGKFMNWKTDVKLLLHKLGNACFAIMKVKYCSDIETLRMIYHAYFCSVKSTR
jgi:hypothetical protein